MRRQLSDDSLAIILLCSHLAIGKGLTLKPLNDPDWSLVIERLRDRSLSPGQLLGQSASQVQASLELDGATSERLAALLSRGGQLALELGRLSSLGIWVMTRADPDYPTRLRKRLRQRMPAVFFGIGPPELMSRPGIAIVGSRSLDDEGLRYATEAGRRVAEAGAVVFSGGSKGVDAAAMKGALSGSGPVVGVLSEGVARSLRDSRTREHVLEGEMTLASPFHPDMSFRASNAMARNKIVYCLAEVALVVSASAKTGGTWAGATEALRGQWVPVYVRNGVNSPPGNQGLIREGAVPAPFDPTADRVGFSRWIQQLLVEPGSSDVPGRASDADHDPVFEAVFPLMSTLLEEPRGATEIAERLRLEPAQAQAWLTRGFRLGLLAQDGSTFRLRKGSRPAGRQEQLPFG